MTAWARSEASRLERLLDPAMWAWCWLACQLLAVVPLGRRGSPADGFGFWLLPFAGYWAYHEPGGVTSWRWSARLREPKQ